MSINITKAEINGSILELEFTTVKPTGNYSPERIAIDNQTSFICKNEESKAAFKANITKVSGTYSVDQDFDLSTSAFNTNSDLLFVYIYSNNGSSREYLEAVVPVFNTTFLYDKIYNTLKSDFSGCSNNCSNTNTSISMMNLYNGFKFALNTGDYKGAINYWNSIFNNTTTNISGCNCN